MSANPTLPITYGTVSGSPITGKVNSATLASKIYVTLSANYQRSVPPGYPDPNAGDTTPPEPTQYPQTIPSGTRLQLFSDEAAALVTASAAAQCKLRIDAGMARIAACEVEAAELLKEAEGHLAAIQFSVANNREEIAN